MSRDLTSGVQTAIEATQVQPFLLFEGLFASGYVRVWSGYGDIVWDGRTWIGVGSLAGISAVQETAEIQANGISVTLSGVPSEFISLVLQESEQGKSGKVYIGFLDASGIIADPYLAFEGKLDIPSIQESGEDSLVTITYESRLIDLQRPRESRLTNEEQQREYVGDLGCEFVPAMKEVTLNWGRS
jgi:hypothetical protein